MCTLAMRSVGLYKLHRSSCERCDGSQSVGQLAPLLAMWLLNELQHHIFRHPMYRQVAIAEYERWCR